MTRPQTPPVRPPTLEDCDREPIHIPGAIQQHGALLAFEARRLVWYSENLLELFGFRPVLGEDLHQLSLLGTLAAGLDDDIACGADQQHSIVVSSDGRQHWSRVVHRHDDRLIIEFERLSASGHSDMVAPAKLLSTIKGTTSLESLLQLCCDGIRRWTGFDRVMGYVFRPDDSGEVVVQSRSDRIDSFLGMRFPASDIPMQARALYVRNTLRFIADVDYRPVGLVGRAGERPLDLSGAILRSVSPIHIEYLQNMGIRASMSVSIVLDNRLWGMFACHHNEPLQVPLATREACDMVAHFAATRIQAILANQRAARHEEAASLTSQLGGHYGRAEDPVRYLASVEADLRHILRADGLVIAHKGKVVVSGEVPSSVGHSVAQHFAQASVGVAPIDAREDWPEELRQTLGEWVGALPIDFDPALGGRVIAMRREQVSTVRWAGIPGKVFGEGPNGARLSPRGSFAEWQETVRGQSAPWLAVTREIAGTIRTELSRAAAAQQMEIEDGRRHLLAMLGHDLRSPLQAIRMSAAYLKRSDTSRDMAVRIDNSSGRMQRLIAQILDFSRVEAGLPLIGEVTSVDLAELCDDLLAESKLAHPGVVYDFSVDRPANARVDVSRYSQAISNLLSNARHHSSPGSTIDIDLTIKAGVASFVVANEAPPIPIDVVKVLFDPFKRAERAPSNRSGLGLGLYITYRIALALGGDLAYGYRDGRVVFTFTSRVDAE